MSAQDPVPQKDRHRENAPITTLPRAFILQRDVDMSGVSGTGVVAWGVEFPDGVCALRWTSQWPTSVVFHDNGMEGVQAVHGHDGMTRVIYTDEMDIETVSTIEGDELPIVIYKDGLRTVIGKTTSVSMDDGNLSIEGEIDPELFPEIVQDSSHAFSIGLLESEDDRNV